MKMKDRLQGGFSRVEGPAKELLGRLSRSQRISLSILAGAVVLMFTMVIAFTPEDTDVPVSLPDDEKGLMAAGLKEKGIAFEKRDQRLVVKREDIDQATAVAIESGLFTTDKGYFKWLYNDTSWNETSGHRAEKVLDTLRRRTEAAILAMDGVESVVLNVQMQKGSVFVEGKRPSTASVALGTARRRLDTRIADGIQRFVAFSFGLKVEDVSLTDDFGSINLQDGSAQISDKKRAREGDVVEKVQMHLGMMFTPRDFIVTADIKINSDKKRTIQRDINPDASGSLKSRTMSTRQEAIAGALPPGVKPNVVSGTADPSQVSTRTVSTHEETEFNTEHGYKETVEEKGRGVIEKVSILVTVSISKLQEQIRMRRSDPEYAPTAEEIQVEVQKLEDLIRSSAADALEVEAKVHAAFFTDDSSVSAEDTLAFSGFMQLHGRELILAGLAVFGCFMLYRIAVKSVPELEALPDPVSDLQSFLEEKKTRDQALAEELARKQEEGKESAEWEASEEDRDTLDLLKAVAEFAEDRPELASTVVRSWITEPDMSNTKPIPSESATDSK